SEDGLDRFANLLCRVTTRNHHARPRLRWFAGGNNGRAGSRGDQQRARDDPDRVQSCRNEESLVRPTRQKRQRAPRAQGESGKTREYRAAETEYEHQQRPAKESSSPPVHRDVRLRISDNHWPLSQVPPKIAVAAEDENTQNSLPA